VTPFACPKARLDALTGRSKERAVLRLRLSRRAGQTAENPCRGNTDKGMSIEAGIAGNQGCVQRLEIWQFEQHAESLSRSDKRYSRFSGVYSLLFCIRDRSAALNGALSALNKSATPP
jgi:hypothetical protein